MLARRSLFRLAHHPLHSDIAACIKSHPFGWISGDSHWDTKRIVADSDRKYLAIWEVWIAFFQYSGSAIIVVDLHNMASEKVDTQNPVDMPLTTAAQRAKIDR